LYVGHLCELSAQPEEQRGGQETAAKLPTPDWRLFPALLSAAEVEPRVLPCNREFRYSKDQ
jgi:hypothetical protein